jgi:hypothetical protein
MKIENGVMDSPQAGPTDPVGIVVSSGASGEERPRAVAFVWGARVSPAPSLPYGRWKVGVRPAA